MKIGDGLTPWISLAYFPPSVVVDSVFDGGNPDTNYGDIPDTIDCGGVN
jgi:hypothetical protein